MSRRLRDIVEIAPVMSMMPSTCTRAGFSSGLYTLPARVVHLAPRPLSEGGRLPWPLRDGAVSRARFHFISFSLLRPQEVARVIGVFTAHYCDRLPSLSHILHLLGRAIRSRMMHQITASSRVTNTPHSRTEQEPFFVPYYYFASAMLAASAT